MLTPKTCRAARALLNWTIDDLALASGIADRTVSDFEREVRPARAATEAALRGALERHGVVFIVVGDIIGVGCRENGHG